MKIKIISAEQVHELLTMSVCIDIVRDAMVEVSRRNVNMPLRHGMPIPDDRGMLGMMYGYLAEPECFGVKLLSLYPGNAEKGISSHMGLMVLYEAECGKPVAIMDASVITAIRTAAASAVATDELARTDAKSLAILGGGEQAESHLKSMLEVRPIDNVLIWCRSRDRAHEFAIKQQDSIDANIEVVNKARDAAGEADIVCTVTSSPEPILEGQWLRKGTHLNLVGSSLPHFAEVDNEVVTKTKYFVDYRESTLAQAGEFLRAKEAHLIDDSHIVAEIGEVISKEHAGRESDDEITLYKSLGVIAQDLVSANTIFKMAIAQDKGLDITM